MNNIRKLAIFFTTLIFAATSFGTANAQFFDPDGGGLGSTSTNLMDWEEWEETCGTTWECNWALIDELVMSQMLGGVGFAGIAPSGLTSDDLALLDAIRSIHENGGTVVINTNTDVLYWDYGFGPGLTMSAGEYVDWIVDNPAEAMQWIINFGWTGDPGDPINP